MAASAGAESLCHYRPIEEGDRKGGGDCSTCNYKSIDEEDQQ
jgi:hypothetical protein